MPFIRHSSDIREIEPFPLISTQKLHAKGAVVHCDETWCRVKVNGKYGKKYIWSMVNELARVAVYFYDDGSRSRDVLREFLGNTEIDALQSDGYIDNSLAERSLRTMTVERKRSSSAGLLPTGRKNSLGFGSHAGAKVSVIYHTFIETCKMCGVSTLEYFKEFFKTAIKREETNARFLSPEREQVRMKFRAIMQGRTDYERSSLSGLLPSGRKNLLPMTISVKNY